MKHAFFILGSVFIVPDRLELEDGAGRRWEVVNPKWWRIDRWIWWWLAGSKHRTKVKIVWADGWSLIVRVREQPE